LYPQILAIYRELWCRAASAAGYILRDLLFHEDWGKVVRNCGIDTAGPCVRTIKQVMGDRAVLAVVVFKLKLA
jgi:hypothetical protein